MSEQDQSERFQRAAHQLGVDLDEDHLRELLRKVALVKDAKWEREKRDDTNDDSSTRSYVARSDGLSQTCLQGTSSTEK